jgi:hypothetical protein
MFLTDALPPELEQRRRDLLERRARLRAQAIGDPADREMRDEIEKLEAQLKALDRSTQTER